MASERVILILKTKGATFTDEEFAEMTDAEGWRWLYKHFPKSGRRRPSGGDDSLPGICFTGFRDVDMPGLKAAAAQLGFRPVSGVTSRLRLLVLGDFPGPVKMQQARALGLPMATIAEFRADPAGWKARASAYRPPPPQSQQPPQPAATDTDTSP